MLKKKHIFAYKFIINNKMLQQIIENTGIESALLFDANSNVIDSYNMDTPKRIAAMSNTIFEMCKGLTEDLKENNLNQIIIKGEALLIIGNKINNDKYLVSITKDITKLGLLLKVVDNLSNELI